MKGRQPFTHVEAEEIRQLIEKKLVADTAAQKRIRKAIRELGFNVSDFSSKKRFTVHDFDRHAEVKE